MDGIRGYMAIHLKKFSFLLIILLTSCSGLFEALESSSQVTDSTTSSDSTNLSNLSLDGITEINFDGSDEVSVQVENVDSNAQYVMAIYSSNYEDSSNHSFEISAENSSNPSVSALTQSLTSDTSTTEDIHEMLRYEEENLGGQPASPSHVTIKALGTSLSVGSTKNFKVLNSLSNTSDYETVEATLRYQSDHFLVYVDVRNEDAVSDEDLAEVLEPFENVIDDMNDLFGKASDVNGDGHFTILMTQSVNELGSVSGGILTGYFYAIDLYEAHRYAASNEQEIIYTLVPDPTGEFGTKISSSFTISNIFPSVFPHEYQHMINYNQHVLLNDGLSEESFLNEALSHLAEDIYSMEDGYMTETGIENPARIAYYLHDTDSVCFTCGSSLSERGASYLFIRYLYEQAQLGNLGAVSNGAELVERLLDTDRVGVDNILEAAMNSSQEDDFNTLMGLFTLAISLSDADLISDNRFQFQGLSLRDTYDDNRNTQLDGPNVIEGDLSLTQTLASSTMSFVSLSGEDLVSVDGRFTLSLSSQLQGGGYLIELTE